MKKILVTMGLLLILIGLIILKHDYLIEIYNKYFNRSAIISSLDDKNAYYINIDFMFIQNTTDFIPKSRKELVNIYYTIINSGISSFSFICSDKYEECLDDVKELAYNQGELSDINNYVHPFNGFSHIETEYDSLGRVTVNIVKTYSDEKIDMINKKIDEIYQQLVYEKESVYKNINIVKN